MKEVSAAGISPARFPLQVFHGIFSSALRAKTYSENIAMKYLRLFSGRCNRKDNRLNSGGKEEIAMPYFLNMFMRGALKKIWHRNLFDNLVRII